ncbi:MAG: methyltransferase domain-containing protein [Actinobacteria bacterium]|nr:methyltransferase domain-containing protein [Actinomycetota bacterium]
MWYVFAVLQDPGPPFYDGPTPDLFGVVFDALRDIGRVGFLDSDDMAALDEYHPLGRGATLALADLAGVAPGEKVIDVGAGLGGASRVLARYYGATVTALDATPRFNALNEVFCDRSELEDKIRVMRGDARRMPISGPTFDVGWTQALWQDIEDKQRLASELHRVIVPGGRLALFELVTGPGGELHYPLPWADGPEGSFPMSSPEMRKLLFRAEFTEIAWKEGPEVVAAAKEATEGVYGMKAGAGLPGVDLSLVVPNFAQRVANLGRNIEEGRIGVVMGVLRRDSPIAE